MQRVTIRIMEAIDMPYRIKPQRRSPWMLLATVLLPLVLVLILTSCADKGVQIQPKGQMVIGGSVGG